jgi:hypothetical protein
LAERLITKYENNPPATGIYTFKYYLWDCSNVLTAGLKWASFF